MSDKDLIVTQALCKAYTLQEESIEVLKGIDLTVARGEIVSIVGPSGVGKSTLLHILGALDQPTSGTVTIDGQSLSGLGELEMAELRNRKVGFVFQFHYLLPEFTALENVMMPAFIGGRGQTEVQPHAEDLLSQVGMDHRMQHRPNELSGGEQQRVAFARALINKPAIVLADEPTGNLDREASATLHRMILQLCRERQLTFLIVTHNESLAAQTDRIVTLQDGRIQNDNAPH